MNVISNNYLVTLLMEVGNTYIYISQIGMPFIIDNIEVCATWAHYQAKCTNIHLNLINDEVSI